MGGYAPVVLLAMTGNGIKNGLFIYIFRQNFRSMPTALEEAAYVDGAGHIRIFTRIMLPNAITTIVTVALFSFVWQYNDTYYSGIYLNMDAGILSLKSTRWSVIRWRWRISVCPSVRFSIRFLSDLYIVRRRCWYCCRSSSSTRYFNVSLLKASNGLVW